MLQASVAHSTSFAQHHWEVLLGKNRQNKALLEEHHDVRLNEDELEDDRIKVVISGGVHSVQSAENELTEVGVLVFSLFCNFH